MKRTTNEVVVSVGDCPCGADSRRGTGYNLSGRHRHGQVAKLFHGKLTSATEEWLLVAGIEYILEFNRLLCLLLCRPVRNQFDAPDGRDLISWGAGTNSDGVQPLRLLLRAINRNR